MTSRTNLNAARAALFAVALGFLAGCAMAPGQNSVCTEPGPNNPGWPYCAPAEPGGPGPADDPIDPTGRGVSY